MRSWAAMALAAACAAALLSGLAAGARPTATSAAGDGGRRLLDDFSDGTFGRQVTGDGVNVRDKPCTDTKILGVVNEGDKVSAAGWAAGWCAHRSKCARRSFCRAPQRHGGSPTPPPPAPQWPAPAHTQAACRICLPLALQVHHTGRQRHGKCGHSWSQVSFKDQEAWIALEFLTYCPGRTCTEPRM